MHRMVPAEVVEVAETVSAAYRRAGIPHAFIGGLAVGHYGYERMTRDVDLLVNKRDLAKIEGRPMAISGRTFRIGSVDVDVVSPPGRAALFESLLTPAGGYVPFPALVLLKVMSGRQKDMSDLVELTKVDPGRTKASLRWLKERGALSENVFSTIQEIMLTAEHETRGGGMRRKNPSGGKLLSGRYRRRV